MDQGTRPETETGTQTETELDLGVVTDTGTEAGTETETETGTEKETETGEETGTETGTETVTETGSEKEMGNMATFRIRARETIEIEVDVEAGSLDEAIELVEGCEVSGVERDSWTRVTHYAIDGVMGWNNLNDGQE